MFYLNRGRIEVEITKELRRLRAKEPGDSPGKRILRTNIMGYELGAIQEYTSKNSQKHLESNIKKGYEENAKLGMADLIVQCRMLCLDAGWDFDKIQKMGLDHLTERHEDFKKDGFGDTGR